MVSVSGHLLGPVSFSRDGRALLLSPASSSLLAYLLLRRGSPVDRARLAHVVDDAGEGSREGGGEGPARRRLNSAIWRLRRQLEPDGVARESVLASVDQSLAVAPDCVVWVDAVEFESACLELAPFDRWTDDDAELAARSVELYRGDFLEGSYTEWALAERGRLADLHLLTLIRLAQWHQHHGHFDTALSHARAAVGSEPLREDLHRLVMQLYADAGLPQLAEQQLRRCRSILADELGVEPLPETVAVAEVAAGPTRPSADAYDRAIHELESSEIALRRASVGVQTSLRELRREREQLLGR